MSYTTPNGLLSLAHPIIASFRHGAGQAKSPLYLPPFPEIDLRNWDGFTLSHLHWVGVRATPQGLTAIAQQRAGLALLHEYCHRDLAHMPFSLLKKYEMFIFYSMILKAIEEKGASIEVPLDAETPRNQLEKQWGFIVGLQRASELVEEVYAVRSSLEKARAEGFIEPKQIKRYILDCKAKYEKYIPLFGGVYDAFDLIWEMLGEDIATTMIFSVLETFKPDLAFKEVLSQMCQSDLSVPSPESQQELVDVWKKTLPELSLESVFRLFGGIIDKLDHLDHEEPYDRNYDRKGVLDRAEKIKEQWHAASQVIQDDLGKFLLGSPNTILFSHYNRTTHRFSKFNVTEEVRYGNFIIVLEAVRQQLTTGRGVLCPFWKYSRDNAESCCSSHNRAFLDQVWSCTSHNESCNWKRMGCLAKDDGKH
jgi:hypothetical protein